MDFFNTLDRKYNIRLNSEQREAVRHGEGPALILAGPGSGKTTVITARAAFLIKEAGIRPQNILTLTFNKAAQQEMEKRFGRLYGSDISEKVHFATLHSFCNRVVREYERMKGRKLQRIEGSEQETGKHKLLKDIYLKINNSRINDDELENLINEIGLVKNSLIKEFEGLGFNTKRFPQVYRAYEDYKKSNLLIDFDDMLTYAFSILTKYPRLLAYYRNKYTYIQVDEAQDLSKIQFELIRLLSAESGNVFIVADDDQSIYGFRGAEPQYILDFEKQFGQCSIYRLERNYRSAGNIVRLSSSFIRQNKNRYDKNHAAVNASGKEPETVKTRSQREQLKFILDKLEEGGNSSGDIPFHTAVLYRNNLSSILVADLLERNGIGFKIRQNKLHFFRHWLVQEITAFLHFALNPRDVEAFSKIYYRMNRYISKAMLECALSGSGNRPVIDCIMDGIELKPFQLEGLQAVKLEFAQLAEKRPWNALEYIKNNFKYLESVKEYCGLMGISCEYNYRLFEILQEIAYNCSSIVGFLDRLAELDRLFEGNNAAACAGGGAAVTLSTLHSSKGLEYDCVFMIDLINSELPGDKLLEKAVELKDMSVLEEERRLFYVGMTRARQELYLVYPSASNHENLQASVFISEVCRLFNNELEKGFSEGAGVIHKKFGQGSIVSMEPNSMTARVRFKDGQVRTLDLRICIENRMIMFEDIH
ncbi:putative ATP-dependent DNA helicase YjcD [Ruminiclostridium hungatei]|uniref:DNA 3'-5' helicase n=1 Tax=Ruminiclostridium hungatei TaxID=48256 RepID=A0A1V4SH24_RUMHU|nr:ATP-dependent helicase [Ruminiclostridium hungatei]OPX43178.1 putative ATP-dependent DNA helicase YjcD [Ruminiclostridium hungatei]